MILRTVLYLLIGFMCSVIGCILHMFPVDTYESGRSEDHNTSAVLLGVAAITWPLWAVAFCFIMVGRSVRATGKLVLKINDLKEDWMKFRRMSK